MTSDRDRTEPTDPTDPPLLTSTKNATNATGSNAVLTRRSLLCQGGLVAGGLALSLVGARVALASGGADEFGPLQPADANGLMLPKGFSSRIVAQTGRAVGTTGHIWHPNPDGGATFATQDGGWVYVSNSETSLGGGGVGAIRFARDGSIQDAYSILAGTNRNCAGGPTPWGSWLSCEETSSGEVYECDPMSPGSQGTVRSALGRFKHEAAAVDPVRKCVYLTEDEREGLFYRFTPDRYPSLGSGTLEAAEILGAGDMVLGEPRGLIWHSVPNATPTAGGLQLSGHSPLSERATRYQVPSATPFAGGEGCWYERDSVFFATKGDSRVWQIHAAESAISLLYDLRSAAFPELSNPDNVLGAGNGDIYVAEDPGNLQIVALTPSGGVKPIVQLDRTRLTELCGQALSPAGDRLYFSSQRHPGITYEVAGPFVSRGSSASQRR